MSTITSTSSTETSGKATSTSAESLSKLDENYKLFLTVLTTQLKNQNPLNPTDPNEMTQQLISYSQVEQQILGNQYLENLVLSTNNQTAETALAFVGKEVVYTSDNREFSGEKIDWKMTVPESAKSVSFVVTNAKGDVIYSKTETPESGAYTFTWDGATTAGSKAVDGSYTLTAKATLADDKTKTIDLQSTSTVAEVDWSSGAAQLKLANGSLISLSNIVTARVAAAKAA
ncbi:flagellar hook assembly protein FlgD [Rhodospirillum rubrum]|uniref:Basal-body rod modification protein FlgD n=1 Tax=Rhodospirillum rubrum (strain ATCC 11170 / ATH 1.1.1 / DSM 467 / LMG 4362 / NCIMB 8255 / S1) TaxID=269796 RepID=Q2RRB2_RHORT|nr:flagellar hook capping FlgD N-terminal domain-containing protein [Rhodospirillum rubrum]ABC23333.1 Flagellar hook capping protein [Rhodospirillum rubrum ATCC 11170]AEO49066.1 flagellar hook capping protein [Rhodospirillum rubrum F11]MBK5954976.1 flagellar hook capping protein [Rhodospirillum rubrum]QXG79306.1 flagellar hook capping protein [Rhodospirillum rubrum]HAQ01273.1 flagellar hook capping protein [Rhodospirillum rubrum]